MSSRTLEGAWDCSTPGCLETGIPGLTKVCPSCGDPRNTVLTPGEKPYLPDNAREITDPAELELANAGPDWNCGHCGMANRGNFTSCEHCERDRDADDTVNRRIIYDDRHPFDKPIDPLTERIEDELQAANRTIEGRGRIPRRLRDLTLPTSMLRRSGEETAYRHGLREEAERRLDERAHARTLPSWMQPLYPRRRRLLIAGSVIVALTLLVGLVSIIRYMTATEEGSVTVTELTWELRISIEEYQTETHSDWSYPSDARVLDSSREIRSYRTVTVGYETEYYTDYETRSRSVYEPRTCYRTVDNGNGTFSQDSYDCGGMTTEYYSEPVTKSRQVPVTVQEPVYDTKYRYEIDRWGHTRWVTASGSSRQELNRTPRWPEPTDVRSNNTPGDQINEERISNRREGRYTIIYTDSLGTVHKHEESSDRLWSQLQVGETVKAAYSKRTGKLSSVDWQSAVTTTG